MIVGDVLDLAKASELQTLAVRKDDKSILGYINLGLLELYKRFPIETKEVILELESGTSEYILPSDCMYLVSAYSEVPEDSELPYIELPINEEDHPLSVNTVSWNKVQVPQAVDGAYISLIYVASPEMIRYDEVSESHLMQDIPIPPQMIEALLHYVGYRAHAATDGDIEAENTTHYTRFEASCARIEKSGLFTSDDLNMNGRIEDNVWV